MRCWRMSICKQWQIINKHKTQKLLFVNIMEVIVNIGLLVFRRIYKYNILPHEKLNVLMYCSVCTYVHNNDEDKRYHLLYIFFHSFSCFDWKNCNMRGKVFGEKRNDFVNRNTVSCINTYLIPSYRYCRNISD